MRKITDETQIAERKRYRRDYAKAYYQAHGEKYREYHRLRYQRDKERILERQTTTNFVRKARIKTEVLTYYGYGILACVHCGYGNIDALTIDHINGNGKQHRKEHKLSGDGIYRWLASNSLPEGYQTLCANCQRIKAVTNGEQRSILEELGYA